PSDGGTASGWTSPCGDAKACALVCDTNTTPASVCASGGTAAGLPAPAAHFSFNGFVANDADSSPCGSATATNCQIEGGNVLPTDGIPESAGLFGKTIDFTPPGGSGPVRIPPGYVTADKTGVTTFTVAAWVRPVFTGPGLQLVVNEGNGAAPFTGFGLFVDP